MSTIICNFRNFIILGLFSFETIFHIWSYIDWICHQWHHATISTPGKAWDLRKAKKITLDLCCGWFFNGLYLGVIPSLNAPQNWEVGSPYFFWFTFSHLFGTILSCMRIESSAHGFFRKKHQSRKSWGNSAGLMMPPRCAMFGYLTWRYT